ncbi:MAG TPA: hypothetical protein VK932_01980, partial [Kofleriaceae bacterium]|nr:hypothetical protein [Kofleriaceae bacterium]
MVLSKARIVAVGETPYAHEREGIEFAEQALPDTDPFYNPRAPQIWLTAFDQPRLIAVGRRVGDLYGSKVPERIRARAGDPMVETIARA